MRGLYAKPIARPHKLLCQLAAHPNGVPSGRGCRRRRVAGPARGRTTRPGAKKTSELVKLFSGQNTSLHDPYLAWIIHEQATAVADSSKTPGLAGGRAPSGCSAVCKANCKATRKRVATCCKARARPNGTGPAPYSPRSLPARPGDLLLWQFASQTA